jgi:hypothetical protein
VVGAPGPPVSPPRGPVIDVFNIGDGRSRFFSIAIEGAYHADIFSAKLFWVLVLLRIQRVQLQQVTKTI